jgi:PIN domain nuclease of toxin-antitoxin system
MRILLDTFTFLWMVSEPKRLRRGARQWAADPASDLYLSAVSVWEIATKWGLGRLKLRSAPSQFVRPQREAHAIEAPPLDEEAAAHVASLPLIHGDPFDRLLVSQAIVHGLVLLTPGEWIARYPARAVW